MATPSCANASAMCNWALPLPPVPFPLAWESLGCGPPSDYGVPSCAGVTACCTCWNPSNFQSQTVCCDGSVWVGPDPATGTYHCPPGGPAPSPSQSGSGGADDLFLLAAAAAIGLVAWRYRGRRR